MIVENVVDLTIS